MRIYTRTGDEGETGLFGGGRVAKSDARVAAYGDVDELNAVLGWVLSHDADPTLAERVRTLQADLLVIGAHLATPPVTRGARPALPEPPHARAGQMEGWMDAMEARLPELRRFILPGGGRIGAALHLARTVCRRAERSVVALSGAEPVEAWILTYLNRLSDLLFVMARDANQRDARPESEWKPAPDSAP